MKRLLFLALWLVCLMSAQAQQATNYFNDPFLQVTSAMSGCPAPRPPAFTAEEVRKEEHVRSQHGGNCYRVGRCRLSNSYLYDKEIIPRVQTYIREDGRFNDTSIWILGERRLVTLMGCVKTKEQSMELERTVMLVDDVMGVVNHLVVGTQAKPLYKVVPASR